MTSPENALTIRGRAVRFDEDGLACLNDIWLAAGYSKHKSPGDWTRLYTTQKRIERVVNLNTGKSRNLTPNDMRTALRTKRGRDGGTWADPRLALDYAEYLNPALAIEVKEIFLRYKGSDPTLADEIMDGASREANEWIAKRSMSRAARIGFTDTLKAHGVNKPSEFGACTNATYGGLFGKTAEQLKADRKLKKGASLRDAMTLKELATVSFSEVLSTDRIEEEGRMGFYACREATAKVAGAVRQLLDADQRDRQPKLPM